MAAVTASNVTLSRIKQRMDAGGAQWEITMEAAIVCSGQGGTAADIPASLFNLSRIHSVSGGVLNASGTITFVPGGTDTYTYPVTGQPGPAGGGEVIPFPFGSSGSRGNITGTWYIRVTGIA